MLKPATARTGATVGQFAGTAGVNVETVRCYRRIGLLSLLKDGLIAGEVQRLTLDVVA